MGGRDFVTAALIGASLLPAAAQADTGDETNLGVLEVAATAAKIAQLAAPVEITPERLAQAAQAPAAPVPLQSDEIPEMVLVTAPRFDLLGQATTSSQGIILKEELLQLPVYRAGQLLETVPGLVVTIHSGEGKANQYLLRGFNLDHGTDLATFVDAMPVNMRTHGHGQGYTDLNFFIPELATGINYTKGPYFAAEGDYASVAAVHIGYLDQIEDQAAVTAGSWSYERLFGAATRDFMNGRVLGALELVHYDGPWSHPDNVRKINAVLRYSEGEARDGWSVTAMYYRGLWNATTDQPERAMDPAYMASLGLTPISRFGTLDPSDAGQAQRMSLSGTYSHGTLDWHVDANAYVINSDLTLWNDFTHFLNNPVHGDQEAQNDLRMIYGGGASYTDYSMLLGHNAETVVGLVTRYDDIHVQRLFTEKRKFLSTDIDDKVQEWSVGGYAQLTNYWAEWFRSVIGLREDYYTGRDRGTNTGSGNASIFMPKASLIFTPFDNYEFYISAGRGFHSNDFRSVPGGGQFLTPTKGAEIGIRANPITGLTTTVTLFRMELNSEIKYDAEEGQTSAGPPSKRTGLEINTTYQPFDWLEIYASVALTHARFTGNNPEGNYIPDAPAVISNVGIYIRDAGPWFGALEWRYIGQHPLIEDNSVRSEGDQEWNLNIGYNFSGGWKAQLGIFNLFDSKDNAAEYFYGDRISPNEPLLAPDGNPDIHIHPLEPRAFRFTVSKQF
jgi:outer membrane cobalamin receptor